MKLYTDAVLDAELNMETDERYIGFDDWTCAVLLRSGIWVLMRHNTDIDGDEPVYRNKDKNKVIKYYNDEFKI